MGSICYHLILVVSVGGVGVLLHWGLLWGVAGASTTEVGAIATVVAATDDSQMSGSGKIHVRRRCHAGSQTISEYLLYHGKTAGRVQLQRCTRDPFSPVSTLDLAASMVRAVTATDRGCCTVSGEAAGYQDGLGRTVGRGYWFWGWDGLLVYLMSNICHLTSV